MALMRAHDEHRIAALIRAAKEGGKDAIINERLKGGI